MKPSKPTSGLSPRPLALALLILASPSLAQPDAVAEALTLERAVQIAVESDDPALGRHEARAEAFEQRAVAEAQLPDPRVSTQIANVPVDTFSFDQAEMTQVRFGLRQEFPPGRTLAVRGEQRRHEAEAERARRALELREIALATRIAWYELAWRTRAIDIVGTSRESVAEQIESLSSRFATGRMNAQDVLRAELELALLDDQLAEHGRHAERARAMLSRYIGGAARQRPADWPAHPEPAPASTLQARLADHPAVAVRNAQIDAAEADVEIAEQSYKPAFALEGGYGVRHDRADFASIGVTLSVPLFTDKRQDRQRAAAVSRRGAEQMERDALLRELKRRLEQARIDWSRYGERLELYERALGERARQTAEASVTTYANGQTDFAELIRSQLAELDVDLKRAELRAEAGKAWAQLAYLTGESP